MSVRDDFIKARDSGHLFTVVFEKKDGTSREMICRGGVHKYVTGQGMRYDPLARGMMTVFEQPRCPGCGRFVDYSVNERIHSCGGRIPAKTGGYKLVTLANIKSVKVKGETHA